MSYNYRDYAPSKAQWAPPAKKSKKSFVPKIFFALVFLSALYFFWPAAKSKGNEALSPVASEVPEVPAAVDVKEAKREIQSYTYDAQLQKLLLHYLEGYKPNVGVYLICDLKTGRILALGERQDSIIETQPHLSYGKSFPAASLVKIVTSMAALKSNYRPEDSLVLIGSYHTLYKRQLRYSPDVPHKKLTLEYAFARSINPSFGLLGYELGPQKLGEEANLLGFNVHHNGPLSTSILVYPDTGYHLAELSCGFTRKATISPLHTLELIRALGDDGSLKPLEFNISANGEKFEGVPINGIKANPIASKRVLTDMQSLMEASVSRGTCRKSFHRAMRRDDLDKLILGAKTGSLDGKDPTGRYDWFAGYAKLKDSPELGIGLVVLQVHQEYQTLISSRIAALIIKDWARKARDRAS